MVNQLSKFIDNLAALTKPLRALLRSGSLWIWDTPQEDSFQAIIKALTNSPVLSLYNQELETIVSADSSSFGLGSVILQRHLSGWKPVAYASRSLTDTEQKYPQIDKEALAIVWACEKFEDYLLGLPTFLIETDHKPLVSLLGTKDLTNLPIHIQRYRMRLLRYSYSIVHVAGKNLSTADCLSRAPSSEPTENDIDFQNSVTSYVNLVVSNFPSSNKRLQEIIVEQLNDDVCKQLYSYCMHGWPRDIKNVNPVVKPYFQYRNDISVIDNLLICESRIIIPQPLQTDILGKIHEGHLGITKCRELAKFSVWWPGISKSICDFIKNCDVCSAKAINNLEPLNPTDFPSRPWCKLASDLFEFKGSHYLLVVDYFSRYIEVAKLTSLTSHNVITHLKSMFSHHGIPEIFFSDNGTQYSSAEFAYFAKCYGFIHQTSSPLHSSGNGEAERAVRTAKQLMDNKDPYIAFLNYRNAPLRNGYSPAELLMGRSLNSKLPVISSQLQSKLVDVNKLNSCEHKLRGQQKVNFDKRHLVKNLPKLCEGDSVFLKDRNEKGVVTRQVSHRSYAIETSTGNFRRNRFHINKLPNAEINNSTENKINSHSGDGISLRKSKREIKLPSRFQD